MYIANYSPSTSWNNLFYLIHSSETPVDSKSLKFSVKPCGCACSVTQSCLTLCDSMDCGLPGSSVHGTQARTLECIAISFSGESSQLRDLNPHLLHWHMDSLPLSHILFLTLKNFEPLNNPRNKEILAKHETQSFSKGNWSPLWLLRILMSICFCWSSNYWNILSGLLINTCFSLGIIYWVEGLFRLRGCLLNFQYWDFFFWPWLKAFKNYELFIWLCQVLVVAHGSFFFLIKIFWSIFAVPYCMLQMFSLVTHNF